MLRSERRWGLSSTARHVRVPECTDFVDEGGAYRKAIGENTETETAQDQPSNGFSISVDGERVAGDAPTPVDAEHKTDLGLEAVDIQVKFDGLDQKPILNVATSDVRRTYRAGDNVEFLATSNYGDWLSRQEVLIYPREEAARRKPSLSSCRSTRPAAPTGRCHPRAQTNSTMSCGSMTGMVVSTRPFRCRSRGRKRICRPHRRPATGLSRQWRRPNRAAQHPRLWRCGDGLWPQCAARLYGRALGETCQSMRIVHSLSSVSCLPATTRRRRGVRRRQGQGWRPEVRP